MSTSNATANGASNALLVGTGEAGTIYLLHFDRPFGHARHYLGWAQDLDARLATHGKAHGPALLRAVAEAGIGWRLARTWSGDRYRERQLKARGHTRKCPICRAERTGQHTLIDPHPSPTAERGPRLRDGWGRYLIPDPATGEMRAWTRATTLAATLADRRVLEAWERRNIVWGIGARPDLYAQAAAATVADTEDLNRIIDHARHAAATAAGANTGSALHRFTERVDAGEDLTVPAPWDRDVAAYRDVLADHHITPVPGWIERVLLVPEAGVAGTCDRLWAAPGWPAPRIGDLKTARNVALAIGEIAVQLALYAHAIHWWDPATRTLHPIAEQVDQTTAVVAHLPAGSGECTLQAIDIAAGWDAVALALDVRAWRRRNDLATPLATPAAPPSPAPPSGDPIVELKEDRRPLSLAGVGA